MKPVIFALISALTISCASTHPSKHRYLNGAVYVSEVADNLSTFAAIGTSTPTDQVIEGNWIRRPMIGLGPAGAVLVSAALDFFVLRYCDWLERRYPVYGPYWSKGIKSGIVGGHTIGFAHNTKIVLDSRRR